jgi:DNA gyrase subunit A
MLFFTESGQCFWLRVFEIPEGTRTSKGRAIQNIINIPKEENIKAYIKLKSLKDQNTWKTTLLLCVPKKVPSRKHRLEAYSRPRSNGINAININEGDSLLEASLTSGSSEIVMALKSGRAIRFNESTVRPMGRTATGVRGITLIVIKMKLVGMIAIDDAETTVLVVSEKGYGKRTDIEDYRVTNRGGKGVKTLNITEKTGNLVAIKGVTDKEDLMIINKSGIIIRMAISELRVMGRATQGVRLITLKNNDEIASVAKIEHDEDEEVKEGDENAEGSDTAAENTSDSNAAENSAEPSTDDTTE